MSGRTVRFTIPGAAVGKGRPIAGKAFGSGFTSMRTPDKTLRYESEVRLFAAQAMAGQPLILGPVSVCLAIWVPIPASWSAKKQREAAAGLIKPTVRPDVDNVEKSVFDGMNGVVWKDDVQVTDVTKRKRYAERPCVEVLVREVQ